MGPMGAAMDHLPELAPMAGVAFALRVLGVGLRLEDRVVVVGNGSCAGGAVVDAGATLLGNATVDEGGEVAMPSRASWHGAYLGTAGPHSPDHTNITMTVT